MIKRHFILFPAIFLALASPGFAQKEPGQYADLNGISMYYEIHGQGAPLLLLHGGLGSSQRLSELRGSLTRRHRVIVPDCRGQGRSTDTDQPLTYDQMETDVLALLDGLQVDCADVVGYSDGGIIGLQLAGDHPERVRHLVVIGANFTPDGLTPDTIAILQSATPETWPAAAEHFRSLAPDPDRWPVLFDKIRTMWLTLPNLTTDRLAQIKAPTLVVAGDRDSIRLEHTLALFHAIPNAQLFIVPGATHLLPYEQGDLLKRAARRFLSAPLSGEPEP